MPRGRPRKVPMVHAPQEASAPALVPIVIPVQVQPMPVAQAPVQEQAAPPPIKTDLTDEQIKALDAATPAPEPERLVAQWGPADQDAVMMNAHMERMRQEESAAKMFDHLANQTGKGTGVNLGYWAMENAQAEQHRRTPAEVVKPVPSHIPRQVLDERARAEDAKPRPPIILTEPAAVMAPIEEVAAAAQAEQQRAEASSRAFSAQAHRTPAAVLEALEQMKKE